MPSDDKIIQEALDKVRDNKDRINARYHGAGFAGGAELILDWLLGDYTDEELMDELDAE